VLLLHELGTLRRLGSSNATMERLPSSDDEDMGEEELTGLAAKSTLRLRSITIIVALEFST
jgi:hypothetical protein